MMRRLYWLINTTCLLALVVVLLGGWTRLNYAGLGCPDWPGCYGTLILPTDPVLLTNAQATYPAHPIDTTKGWLEMIHRYAAGTLGLLILAINLLQLRQPEAKQCLGKLPAVLLVLVIVQAIFGMWTVTLKLLPQVVTLHLLGGMLTVTLLFLLRARIQALPNNSRSQQPATTRRAIQIALLLFFCQLLLGGWTSANYAGWACTDWLSCNPTLNLTLDFQHGFSLPAPADTHFEGGVLPLEARAAIQVVHRVMAVILLAYLLGLSLYLRNNPTLFVPACIVTGVASAQALLGIANALYAVPLPLAMAHHTGALLLLLSLLKLYQGTRYVTKPEVNYAFA